MRLIRFALDKKRNHLFLSIIQLSLHCWSHRELGFRHPDAVEVISRTGKRDLEIASVAAEQRLVQSVIEHLVAHPPKPTAALLDAVEIGQALGQDGVAGTGPILALPQALESDWAGRHAGTGNDHPVGEHFEHDLAPGVFVLSVCCGIDQGFPQRLDGILVQANSVQADHLHRVPRIAVDEGDGAINGQRHGATDVFVVARLAVRFRGPVSVRKDAALRENGGRVFRQ